MNEREQQKMNGQLDGITCTNAHAHTPRAYRAHFICLLSWFIRSFVCLRWFVCLLATPFLLLYFSRALGIESPINQISQSGCNCVWHAVCVSMWLFLSSCCCSHCYSAGPWQRHTRVFVYNICHICHMPIINQVLLPILAHIKSLALALALLLKSELIALFDRV